MSEESAGVAAAAAAPRSLPPPSSGRCSCCFLDLSSASAAAPPTACRQPRGSLEHSIHGPSDLGDSSQQRSQPTSGGLNTRLRLAAPLGRLPASRLLFSPLHGPRLWWKTVVELSRQIGASKGPSACMLCTWRRPETLRPGTAGKSHHCSLAGSRHRLKCSVSTVGNSAGPSVYGAVMGQHIRPRLNASWAAPSQLP